MIKLWGNNLLLTRSCRRHLCCRHRFAGTEDQNILRLQRQPVLAFPRRPWCVKFAHFIKKNRTKKHFARLHDTKIDDDYSVKIRREKTGLRFAPNTSWSKKKDTWLENSFRSEKLSDSSAAAWENRKSIIDIRLIDRLYR